MTIGFYIIIILILGYFTVYLRENWLRVKWLKPLTWLGIFIHEACHALASIITGGKVASIRVTSTEGSVSHYPSKIPVIGPILIALAPLFGGLALLGLVDHFWLKTGVNLDSSSISQAFVSFFSNLKLFSWQALVWLAICLNIGVMLGPSKQDLKNIWLIVLVSFFIYNQAIANIFILAIVLIIINLLLFMVLKIINTFITKI
jgi:hypothetical protein